MATKANSKPCQTSETDLFPQVVTGFMGEIRTCQNSKMELFTKNSQRLKAIHYFCTKALSWMFDKVLNMHLNWLPKLRIFHS